MNAVLNSLDGKIFRCLEHLGSEDFTPETTFHYRQKENVIWATYCGGKVLRGNMVGRVESGGYLTMSYQHLNIFGDFRYGVCHCSLEKLSDGRFRLKSEGESLVGDGEVFHQILTEVGLSV